MKKNKKNKKNKVNVIIQGKYIYIPKRSLPKEVVQTVWELTLFNEAACNKCDYKDERLSDVCLDCASFEGHYHMWNYAGPSNYFYRVPSGSIHAVEALLEREGVKYKVIDRRKVHPFRNKLKFTGSLFGPNAVDSEGNPRVNQEEVVEEWLENGSHGIVRVRPRGGKTVIATYLACHHRQRTLIVADRDTLLKQFYTTFMGDVQKDRPAFTNGPELEAALREKGSDRKVVHILGNVKEIKKYKPDILLVTYQKFIRDFSKINKYLNGEYGFVAVDECHMSSAECYLHFLSELKSNYWLGLSATDKRKDGRDRLGSMFLGPVSASSSTASLIPEIKPVLTGMGQEGRVDWQKFSSWVVANAERNELIVDMIWRDLKKHDSILVPLDRIKHIDDMVEALNDRAREEGKDIIARPFTGKNKSHLDDFNSGKFKVLVAQRSLIKQGVDMSRPSMLYCTIPMSAVKEVGAPLFEQLSNRVCTPYPKPQPIVRVFVDNIGISVNMITGLFWNEIVPGLKGKDKKYKVSQPDFEVFKTLRKAVESKSEAAGGSFQLWSNNSGN